MLLADLSVYRSQRVNRGDPLKYNKEKAINLVWAANGCKLTSSSSLIDCRATNTEGIPFALFDAAIV